MESNPRAYWDFMRSDENLRLVITHRLKSFNNAEICRELGIDRMNLRHYMNGTKPKAVSQYSLWRLCNRIGIKISIKIEYV